MSINGSDSVPHISVAVCTHNPDGVRVGRVLAALRSQSLPIDEWELVLVDNASSRSVNEIVDIGWHPHVKVVVEPELGLVSARIRAFAETSGDVIVFVDDDNVLEPGYLETVHEIGKRWPVLGVWGGQLIPEWQSEPEPVLAPYLGYVGVREFSGDHWSNRGGDGRTAPWGAGMCVRRAVADEWVISMENSRLRMLLGVRGTELMRCEDLDLAFTASDVGLGSGLFESLRVHHLIPNERLHLSYLLRIAESTWYSERLLSYIRSGQVPPVDSVVRRVVNLTRARLSGPVAWRFERAKQRGRSRGHDFVLRLEGDAGGPLPTHNADLARPSHARAPQDAG